jgi:hypothetical protein
MLLRFYIKFFRKGGFDLVPCLPAVEIQFGC